MESETEFYISGEIDSIYRNRENLGAIERAKVYEEHISLLYKELVKMQTNLLMLDGRVKAINHSAKANLAMQEVLSILNKYGYNQTPIG